ncbi:MAG: hypothetical protein NXH70_02430 [Hyphomonas sp.]|nr:hypothetical protein [Hyphomonas sp.]
MKTDLRYIKGASYGVAAPNSWEKRGVSLCEYCAASSFCEMATEVSGQVFTGCADIILPIAFLDRTGLHHKAFSTIRLGKAWHNRLKETPGYVALIYKTKAKQHFLGYAKVAWHHCLPKKEALVQSVENHLIIDRDGSLKEKREYLNKIIRRYYGGFDQQETKPYTVIGLRRLTDDESKRVEASWPVDSSSRD